MTDILNALVLLTNFLFIPALSYGSQLALGALGVTFIYGILRFANFAHGDLMAFGTMATIIVTWIFQSYGLTFGFLPTALFALPFGIIITILSCLLLDRYVFRFYRTKKSEPVVLAMVSIGVMFVINAIVRIIIGPQDRRFFDGEKFIPDLKAGTNTTFLTMDFPGMGKHKIEIFGTTYLDTFNIRDVIDYKISDGYVDDISESQSRSSLIFTLFDPGDDGVLSFTLSDDVITPFDDGSFIVMIDGIESDYILDGDIIKIPFDSSTQEIEIFGTYVIPEFYEIAPLVLATSFIGLIVLKKYKKLFV